VLYCSAVKLVVAPHMPGSNSGCAAGGGSSFVCTVCRLGWGGVKTPLSNRSLGSLRPNDSLKRLHRLQPGSSNAGPVDRVT